MDKTVEIIKLLELIIATGIPTIATIVSYLKTTKMSKRDVAKQSIMQMILEDKIAWHLDREFPTNYGRICDEFEVYHKNGGNGETEKKFNEYRQWYVKTEQELKNNIIIKK